jgi:hypothetical protein
MTILIFAMGLTFASGSAAQTVDAISEINTCTELEDPDARLECFDALGERIKSPKQAPAATETVTAPPRYQEQGDIVVSGKITFCKEGQFGNWLFLFEDGQVWQEVNNRKHRFKDCDFDATITRDGFGHKLQIDGYEKTLRVKRTR